jgi:orotate phosphoribosyltransferase
MDLLKQCQAHVVGVVVALDREETTSVASAESIEKPLSAVQVSNLPRPVLHHTSFVHSKSNNNSRSLSWP